MPGLHVIPSSTPPGGFPPTPPNSRSVNDPRPNAWGLFLRCRTGAWASTFASGALPYRKGKRTSGRSRAKFRAALEPVNLSPRKPLNSATLLTKTIYTLTHAASHKPHTPSLAPSSAGHTAQKNHPELTCGPFGGLPRCTRALHYAVVLPCSGRAAAPKGPAERESRRIVDG
jgi:hypothetical protein